MTVVPPVENTTLALSPGVQGSNSVASQDLFEHAAMNVTSLPHGATPVDLGRTIVDNLKGFVERAGKFSRGTELLANPGQSPSSKSFAPGAPPAEANVTRTSDSEAGRLVEALGKIFDHAIETQMVVRGPTQFTSATMTLVKGQ
jgi:hypothetical protein